MKAIVDGGTRRTTALAAKASEQVDAVFPGDDEVHIVFTRSGFAPGATARCTDGVIYIHPDTRKNGDWYVQYLLYEEIGHFVATQRGLPESIDPLSTLLQELVAGYVQHALLLSHHPSKRRLLTFFPPSKDPTDPMVPYNIGNHIALELLGESESTRILNAYMAADYASEMWAEFIPVLRGAFSNARGPEQALSISAQLYQTAIAS